MKQIFSTNIKVALLSLLPLISALQVLAQDPNKPWKVPGEFQKPRDNWQVPGEIQQPGEFQKPNGEWLEPKEIKVPAEIGKVEIKDTAKCERTLALGADTLFEFDKFELSLYGEKALAALGPIIVGHKPNSVSIEGHTDAKGSDEYNQTLSEKRAQTVLTWLQSKGFLPAAASTVGKGEKFPIAANSKADGADDPEGRQKNRRVEIVLMRNCNK